MRSLRRYRLGCLFILTLLTNVLPVLAQREFVEWHFGRNVRISFASGTPVQLSGGAVRALEGSASICSPDGTFLFATDGITVYDPTGQIMPGGSDLGAHPSSTQAALIVPKPGAEGRYYVFSNGATENAYADGINVAEVDMLARSGLGVVTSKRRQLAQRTLEKMIAVPHANGRDFWLIARNAFIEEWYAWPITGSGIGPAVVNQRVNVRISPTDIGWMRASPDGRRLAVASSSAARVTIIAFDASTGAMRKEREMYWETGVYGVEFSPNGRYLYATNYTRNDIVQWNLTLDSIDVEASRVVVGTIPSATRLGALLRGPDGRIYIAQQNDANLAVERALSVIPNPNEIGTNAGLLVNGFPLANGTSSSLGMPNVITGTFQSTQSVRIVAPDSICRSDTLRASIVPASAVRSVVWTFDNRSFSNNPVAIPLRRDGTFTLQASVTLVNGDVSTVTRTVYVSERAQMSITAPSVVCTGQSFTMIASGVDNVQWFPAEFVSDPLSLVVDASVANTTTFRVVGRNGACLVDTSFTITVPFLVASADTIVCSGEPVRLSAITAAGLIPEWRDATGRIVARDTVVNVAPSSSTFYTVRVAVGSCLLERTIAITVLPAVRLFSAPVLRTCPGQAVQLRILAAGVAQWEPAEGIFDLTSNSPFVTPTRTTTYRLRFVTPDGCAIADSITVLVDTVADLGLADTVDVCAGSEALIRADGVAFVRWVNLATRDTIARGSTLRYRGSDILLEVHGTRGACDGIDTVAIRNIAFPSVVVSASPMSICQGASAQLTASGASAYLWSPAALLDDPTSATPTTIALQSSTTFTLVASNGQCDTTITLEVIVAPRSSFVLTLSNVDVTVGGPAERMALSLTSNAPQDAIAVLQYPVRALILDNPDGLTELSRIVTNDSVAMTIRMDRPTASLAVRGFLVPDSVVNVTAQTGDAACASGNGTTGSVRLVRCSAPRSIIAGIGALQLQVTDGAIQVHGLETALPFQVFDITGRTISSGVVTAHDDGVLARGLRVGHYAVSIGDGPALYRRVVFVYR